MTMPGAARGARAVAPSDTVDLPGPSTGGLYVGTAGTLTVTMLNGDICAFVTTISGTVLPIMAKRVWNTGTGASNMVALYS